MCCMKRRKRIWRSAFCKCRIICDPVGDFKKNRLLCRCVLRGLPGKRKKQPTGNITEVLPHSLFPALAICVVFAAWVQWHHTVCAVLYVFFPVFYPWLSYLSNLLQCHASIMQNFFPSNWPPKITSRLF